MRNRLAVSLGVGLFLLMAVCPVASGQQKAPFAGRVLKAATFGGAWQANRNRLVAQPLEKATGAKVEWVVGNPVDHLAKMIAARGGDPPFDVAELGSIETVQARELGFLETIDRNQVPNAGKVLPELLPPDAVPYGATEFVNAYLPSKFKELGLAPPSRLEDLFHPKLANRIALPFIGGSIMGPRFLVSLAMEGGGGIQNVTPALDRLKTAKVFYFYSATPELEMRMLSGEIWAAYWVTSRPFTHKAAGKDIDFASVGPGAKKATNAVSFVVIAKGSKNKDLAHMYLNHILGLDSQVGMAEWGGVRPVTDDGLKKVLASGNPHLRRVAEVPWKDVFTMDFPPDVDTAAKNIGKWVDQFNREVGGR